MRCVSRVILLITSRCHVILIKYRPYNKTISQTNHSVIGMKKRQRAIHTSVILFAETKFSQSNQHGTTLHEFRNNLGFFLYKLLHTNYPTSHFAAGGAFVWVMLLKSDHWGRSMKTKVISVEVFAKHTKKSLEFEITPSCFRSEIQQDAETIVN